MRAGPIPNAAAGAMWTLMLVVARQRVRLGEAASEADALAGLVMDGVAERNDAAARAAERIGAALTDIAGRVVRIQADADAILAAGEDILEAEDDLLIDGARR